MATNLLDLFGHIQKQGDLGRAEGKRMRLADLASQAYAAPAQQRSGFVQQAIATDPDAGFALGQQLHGDEDQRMQRVGQMAGMLISAPPEARAQLWSSQIVPEMQRIGFGEGLSPRWSEEYLPMAQQIAQQLGTSGSVPSGYQEFDMLARDADLSPEDRALAARRALYLDRRPSNAAIKYEGIEGGDGRTRTFALDPNSPNATQIGGPSAGDPFAFLGRAGATVTSGQRTPEHNLEVGGVPNSYHLTGQARDILPPRDPQQAAMIRQQAAANGLEVIDEGDHWHLEPRGNAPHVNPFVSRRPEDEAAAKAEAEERAKLGLLDDRGRIEAENAAMKARGEAGVQMDTAAGVEAEKTFGKAAADRYEKIQARAGIAESENAQLSVLSDLLTNTYTGAGANAVLGAKRAAAALGISVDGLGEAEAARAIANKLALSLRNPAGGEGMPGQMSDKDIVFLKESIPGLQNSPAGWRTMIQMKMQLNAASIRQAREAERLRREGTPLQDIPGLMREYANRNPVFASPPAASGDGPRADSTSGFRVLD